VLIAGKPLELQLPKSDNIEDWAISSQACIKTHEGSTTNSNNKHSKRI